MNWTIFTAIFTAITAIATFVAAGVALWIACTEQWRQEQHRQKILNSQRCDLVLVPMKEYNSGEQYQVLSGELDGLGRLQQVTATNKYFQKRVTLLSPSELYWLEAERIYGVNIKPDFWVSEAKKHCENTRYFKEVFVTNQGRKHDEQKTNMQKEIELNNKENQTQTPVATSQNNKQVNIKWVEMGSGLGGFATAATVILSLYSFLILFMIEANLKKYNLTVTNIQILPSVFLSGILGTAIIVIFSAMFELLYYATESKIYRVIILLVTYIGILAYVGLWQLNYMYNTLNYEIIKAMFKGILKLRQSLALAVCAVIWCFIWYGVAEKRLRCTTIISYCCRVFATGIILTFVLLNGNIGQNPDYFKTVHIPETEVIKTWPENILRTNNKEQIWAIICETSDYYYIEPIEVINPQKTNAKYKIDVNHNMAIEKDNVIIYGENVKEAYQHYARASQ